MDSNNFICNSLNAEASCKRISQLIKASGIPDKELGKMMNLSVQSINKWHHGRNLPDIENMYLLSKILGTTVDDFLIPNIKSSTLPDIDFEIIQNHSGLLNKRIAYLSKYCAMVFKHDNKMHSVLVSPC